MDFIFEKEVGKAVSTSTKIVRDSTDIHPSFNFIFDEAIHGPELY